MVKRIEQIGKLDVRDDEQDISAKRIATDSKGEGDV